MPQARLCRARIAGGRAAARSGAHVGDEAADPLRGHPLVFAATNVNLCMFQQHSVFSRWWVEAEVQQGLGHMCLGQTTRLKAKRARRADNEL